MKSPLTFSIGIALIAGAAQAQTLPSLWQTRPGAPAIDAQRYRADQSRLEMERLRLAADQRRLEAQLGQLQTQASRDRIVGARQPEPSQPMPLPALRSVDQERTARRSAQDRRRADAAAVAQIDAWLDRPVP